MPGQQNRYKGSPPRACVRLQLVAAGGASLLMELLADTGNPCALVIGLERMSRAKLADGPDVRTNFGILTGGWVRVRIPEIGFDRHLLAYASDVVVAAAQESSKDFQGLVGLPLLRMGRYGGNGDGFWLLPAEREAQ